MSGLVLSNNFDEAGTTDCEVCQEWQSSSVIASFKIHELHYEFRFIDHGKTSKSGHQFSRKFVPKFEIGEMLFKDNVEKYYPDYRKKHDYEEIRKETYIKNEKEDYFEDLFEDIDGDNNPGSTGRTILECINECNRESAERRFNKEKDDILEAVFGVGQEESTGSGRTNDILVHNGDMCENGQRSVRGEIPSESRPVHADGGNALDERRYPESRLLEGKSQLGAETREKGNLGIQEEIFRDERKSRANVGSEERNRDNKLGNSDGRTDETFGSDPECAERLLNRSISRPDEKNELDIDQMLKDGDMSFLDDLDL